MDITELCTKHFRVCSYQQSHKWLVYRRADDKLMTEGEIFHCLRWVKVWGPTRLAD